MEQPPHPLRPRPQFPALLALAPLLLAAAGGVARAAVVPVAGGLAPGALRGANAPALSAASAAPDTLPAALRPSTAARAVADTVRLTGRELGTMWTFEDPPLSYWERVRGFRPDSGWLARARLASVRYGEHCSAAFVSESGLVVTNHHCARDCVEAVSTEEADYLEEGFYAETRDGERVCPGLHLDQLLEIRDVTARVRAAAPEGAEQAETTDAREAEREEIVAACESEGELRCQVVSLYHGGRHRLYVYRRHEPVKLVFAPELRAGFFGGVPDNFAYPRYALDVAFVRAYRPGGTAPVRPDHHFAWDTAGAEDGELVFVTGNPGSTSRLVTVSQLLYDRGFRHPFLLAFFVEQRDFLEEIARQGPQAERQVRDRIFQIENSIEQFEGELEGLRDPGVIGRKIRWEERFRDSVRAAPELARRLGDAWERMARIQAEKLEVAPRLRLNDPGFVGAPHVVLAAELVRYVRERDLPPEERSEGVDEERLEEMGSRIRSGVPAPRGFTARVLAVRLRLAERFLPEDDPLRREAVRDGETPEEAARRIVGESRIASAAFRRRLVEAGPAAVDTTRDPLVALVRGMVERTDRLRPRWEEATASESALEEELADALFAVFGTEIPPDGTFTLRISDGVVRGYPYNGTVAPDNTSFYGLYARSSEFENREPFTLPRSFESARDSLRMETPLDFVSTNDITGGNSGSPVIDRDGRVVGVIFDGNAQQLPNEFLYSADGARAVSVSSAGITEALRAVYGAERLLEELLDGSDREDAPDGGRR